MDTRMPERMITIPHLHYEVLKGANNISKEDSSRLVVWLYSFITTLCRNNLDVQWIRNVYKCATAMYENILSIMLAQKQTSHVRSTVAAILSQYPIKKTHKNKI